jgi:hypothetical protein
MNEQYTGINARTTDDNHSQQLSHFKDDTTQALTGSIASKIMKSMPASALQVSMVN